MSNIQSKTKKPKNILINFKILWGRLEGSKEITWCYRNNKAFIFRRHGFKSWLYCFTRYFPEYICH